MAVFPSKRFRSSKYNGTVPARYRALLAKHPFALFGFPFIATMVLGSFFLTPATAIRYEKHDRKVKQLTKEEELGIGKDRRRIDLKEEYYVRIPSPLVCSIWSDSKRRDWQPKISTTGSKRESRDSPASTTASSSSLLRPLSSFFFIAYTVLSPGFSKALVWENHGIHEKHQISSQYPVGLSLRRCIASALAFVQLQLTATHLFASHFPLPFPSS
jgi:cytochrome c oxidase assembly protein subunit 16